MADEFPYAEDKVHAKTLYKILRRWESALEHSSLFRGLSACQLWYACEGPMPQGCSSLVDRLSFFLTLQDFAVHLTALVDTLAKYTYSAHRLSRISRALFALYLLHYPIPNRSFLRSSILTLPELLHRSDRSQLICECPDAIYLDASEAFSFEQLLEIRSEASSACESTSVEG
jgi:hypothetical protein